MVRNWRFIRSRRRGFPHARGDGPPPATTFRWSWRFSPRAWGWSALGETGGGSGDVFPTRVGMVRVLASMPPFSVGMVRWFGLRSRPWCGFPHACGDGPGSGALKEELDLLQLAARHVTEAGAGTPQIMRGEVLDRELQPARMSRIADSPRGRWHFPQTPASNILNQPAGELHHSYRKPLGLWSPCQEASQMNPRAR